VLKLIHGALNIYDADKTGKVDFALESAGLWNMLHSFHTLCTRSFYILLLQWNPLSIALLYVTLRFMSRNSLSPSSSYWI